MTRIAQLRLGIAAIGIIVWGYGVNTDEPVTRMVGIGLFAVALLLRFAGRRREHHDEPES